MAQVDLIKDILAKEAQAIGDDNWLIATYWVMIDDKKSGADAEKDRSRIYRYLLKHSPVETLLRLKREVLRKNPVLAEQKPSHNEMKELFSKCETPPLIDPREYIENARRIVNKEMPSVNE